MVRKLFLTLILLPLLSACGIWPYKSDFDCPMPEGQHCRSLYAVNQMADDGAFVVGSTPVLCGCDAKGAA